MWRTSLGIGVVFPLSLLYLRFKLEEPEEFAKESMKKATPYKLVIGFYGFRLFCVSLIWFLYNVSTWNSKSKTKKKNASLTFAISSLSTPLVSTLLPS